MRDEKAYSLYPGVELLLYRFQAGRFSHKHPAARSVLEITYCHKGRVGWKLNDGTELYLGPGDMALSAKDLCSDSSMSFPLGYHEGAAISIDLERLRERPIGILEQAGISSEGLFERFCASGEAITIPASQKSELFFGACCRLPEAMREPYFKLKALELLLLLWAADDIPGKEAPRFYSHQTEAVKEIHALLTQNLEQRFTIDALAKKYLMNTSTLKQVFKAVYGQSIAAYMKEYRIRRAMELLRTTDESVAGIARQLGYRSQSRFSEAFREIAQVLPTDYRKQQ